jgi:hypothetical protein
VLQGAPRWDISEAAFALLAQGSQHRVTGFVLIFSAARGLLNGTSTPAQAPS